MNKAGKEAAPLPVRSNGGLAACPCGKTPTDVDVYDAAQGGKWANVQPNCCGEWMIEFRTNYTALDSDECKRLAVEAWNSAPRAANMGIQGPPKAVPLE